MTFPKLLTLYAAAAAIVIVGWVLNVAQLYWMAGTMLLLPTVSYLFGRYEHRGLEIAREMAATGHQGDIVPVKLRIRNLLPLPKLHLSIEDRSCQDHGQAALEPVDPEPVALHLPPRSEQVARYDLRLRRRGLHRLDSIRIQSQDTLGIYQVVSEVLVASEILVYPRIVALPTRLVPPDLGGGQSPLDLAQRQGESSSFYGVREYRPGDPLRHVHWRTAARYGRLAVVEWEAEHSVDAVLAVETASGTDFPMHGASSLDLAAGIAASLASRIITSGDSVRLLVPGFYPLRPAGDRGGALMPGLLEALARMQATSAVPLAHELRDAAERLGAGTVVCWFTAAPDHRLMGTLRYLRERKLNPVLYALIDSDTGAPSRWDPFLPVIESVGVTVVRIHQDDEFALRLLS